MMSRHMDFQRPGTVRITCLPGLTPYLQAEVSDLGYSVDAVEKTYIEITATLEDAMRFNLQLRTAMAVLYLIHAFDCHSPDMLYETVFELPWEEMLSPDGYLCVVARVAHPTIDNVMFAGLKVKDAVVDRLQEKHGRRPDAGPERDRFVLNLIWRGQTARLFLNTTGRKLSDRNYRKIPHTAPMQETLAAGVLLASGYTGREPLVNPMCGSGTLAIEAALIATGRAPGLIRDQYGFMHALGFDLDAWQGFRHEARKGGNKFAPAPIIATDRDARAVEAARRNAQTAGVDHLITFEVCDFLETSIPEGPGIVILNPEYGMRVGEIAALEVTYAGIGDFFKQRCAGYTGYVFTGNLDLAKKVGLRASRRMIFWNAKIECRLLKYELYVGRRE